VLVARPIAFDAGSFARRFVEQIGQTEIDVKTISEKVNAESGKARKGRSYGAN
jgi:hypothetical protein